MCDNCHNTTTGVINPSPQPDNSTTGNPKYVGDCRFCNWPCYEGLTHMCTTAPRIPWTLVSDTRIKL